ncbi:MAG: oligosaccharide flippase family protein [Oscillospiraceae bacterium]|nr:oligosaccharide flippase family protein [Oscillospiraceae bacterium]
MKRQNRVAFFNILSTVLLQGISVFTAPLIADMLGTSGYGVVRIYTIWVSVCAIAFTLQTQGTLVNARVEYPEEDQPKYQSSVMALSLLVFLLCSGIVLLFIRPISGALQLHWFLVLLILFQSFGTFCVNFLNSKFTYEFKADKNMLVSLAVALTTLALSVALILMLPEEINYYGRILALAMTYGCLGIFICAYVLIKGKTFYNREYWKLCLTLALPVVFYNLSDLVLGQSDQVMIQQMLGESQVGQYGLAFNFGGIMFTIFTALNNSWTPFFFEDMKQGRREEMQRQAKNFLELFTVLGVGFVLLATEVYHVFARDREFWDGTILIPVFVTSYYLNFLCTFPVNFEYYHKKTKVVAVVTISVSLVNIGLNYVLIQWVGILGAALATAFSHGLQFTAHYIYVRYILKQGEYPFGIRLWAKYLAVFLVMAVFAMVTPEWAVLRWTLGAAIGLWELRRIAKRKVLI